MKVEDWSGEPWFPPRPDFDPGSYPLRPKLTSWWLACVLVMPRRVLDTVILGRRRRRAVDSTSDAD